MKHKKILLTILTLALTFTLMGCSLLTRADVLYESPSTYEQLRIDMIAEVEPSVVAVITETGHGSGTIFKSELVTSEDPEEVIEEGLTTYYILTNYHVVEDGGEMKVHFGVGQDDIYVMDYQGYEPYDIAVVRIQTTRVLRVHHVGPIDDNTVTEIIKGQDVFAIGSPQDLDKFNYVTSGVVSLVTYAYNNVSNLALMHDAELNPGNSGGALINTKGELIGINTAIMTSSGQYEGFSFAVPSNLARKVVTDLMEYGAVQRGWMGVEISSVTNQLAEERRLPSVATLRPSSSFPLIVSVHQV